MNYTKQYYVYILASRKNGTLYIGVTNDLAKRILEHKSNFTSSFTQKYNVHTLVYFEQTDDIEGAIIREKQLKNWHRKWKIALIEKGNPSWRDLTQDFLDPESRMATPSGSG